MFAATRTRLASTAGLYQRALKEAQKNAETGPLVSFLQAEYSDESKASTAGQKQPFGGNTKSPEELRAQTLENLEIFLANKAIYADLLIRYNPQHDMTEEERVRLTARRVGLDVPLSFKNGGAAHPDISASYRSGAKMAQDRYGEDKVEKQDKLYSGKGDGTNVGGPLRPPE